MLNAEMYLNWGVHSSQLAYFNALLEENEKLQIGRVVFSSHEQYRIFLPALAKEVWGKMRSRDVFPAVGDWVLIEWDFADHQFHPVDFVLPRITEMKRAASSHKDEVMMVNVNHVGLVTSFNQDLNVRRLERGLAMIQASGAEAFVVLNKCDLVNEEQQQQVVAEIRSRLNDIPIFTLSASNGLGLDQITNWIKTGETVAFFGMSGVGKSTLINSLMKVEILKTTPIREIDSRGRHATTHRELVFTDYQFWLMDTPGIREFSLVSDESTLLENFDDISLVAKNCRFNDCQHQSEPGCAIQSSLERGELNLDRWLNFQKMSRELKFREDKAKKIIQNEKKKKFSKIGRSSR